MGKYIGATGLQYLWNKIKTLISGKQDTLVSGTNIKTFNNESLLGSGNIAIDLPQYVICTLSEYEGMASHDNDTYYIIIEDNA